MENKNCTNCGKPIPEGATICISCGTKNGESKPKVEQTPEQIEAKESIKMKNSLIVAGIALLGLIAMIAISSWLGLLIYIATFIYSLINLKLIHEKEDNIGLVEFIKKGFQSLSGSQKYIGIYLIIVFALPIMIILFYNQIMVEMARSVNNMMNSIY